MCFFKRFVVKLVGDTVKEVVDKVTMAKKIVVDDLVSFATIC